MTTSTMNNSEVNAAPAQPRRIREEGSTAAVTYYVETRWPTIGGEDLSPLPEYTFMGLEFSTAYQPGHVAYVYVAGSGDTLEASDQPTGLHGLARRFALPSSRSPRRRPKTHSLGSRTSTSSAMLACMRPKRA